MLTDFHNSFTDELRQTQKTEHLSQCEKQAILLTPHRYLAHLEGGEGYWSCREGGRLSRKNYAKSAIEIHINSNLIYGHWFADQ